MLFLAKQGTYYKLEKDKVKQINFLMTEPHEKS